MKEKEVKTTTGDPVFYRIIAPEGIKVNIDLLSKNLTTVRFPDGYEASVSWNDNNCVVIINKSKRNWFGFV